MKVRQEIQPLDFSRGFLCWEYLQVFQGSGNKRYYSGAGRNDDLIDAGHQLALAVKQVQGGIEDLLGKPFFKCSLLAWPVHLHMALVWDP